MSNQYVSSVAYTAVTAWAATTAYVSTSNGGRGDYRRQLATPAVNSERVFRCTVSGTSGATEPAWTLTKNGVTAADGGVTWTECTGQEADQVAGTWTAPHARLSNVFTSGWSAAGDDVYVANNSAETIAGATSTWNIPGTISSPCRVLSVVVAAGSIPPTSAQLATGAQANITGSGGFYIYGFGYIYGVSFGCGTGSNNGNTAIGSGASVNSPSHLIFKSCAFSNPCTNSNSFTIGGTGNSGNGRVEWDNTTYTTIAAGSIYLLGGTLIWRNTANAVGTPPTYLFSSNGGSPQNGNVLLEGLDLSGMSTKTIVNNIGKSLNVYIKDCNLPAAITIAAPQTTSTDVTTFLVRCDSGSATNRLEKHDSYGDQTTDTTIVRTGGAQVNGVSVSMKLVATSRAKPYAPFVSTPLVATNSVTGANVTVTVYGIWTSAGLPLNDQVWMEVGYLGNAGSTQLYLLSGTKADTLATGNAQTTDASSWGGSTTAFKMTATLSAPQPQLAGEIYVTIKSATTTAVYIDPIVVLS